MIVVAAYINYKASRANRAAINKAAQQGPQLIYISGVPQPTITNLPKKGVTDNTTPWQENSLDSVLSKIKSRQPLSISDSLAKERALSLLQPGQRSGILYISQDIIIDYTYGNSDDWQVEILTTNIGLAKTEAVNWFRSLGFSDDFICNYPVQFYLNKNVSESLSNTGAKFNPLSPECQL